MLPGLSFIFILNMIPIYGNQRQKNFTKSVMNIWQLSQNMHLEEAKLFSTKKSFIKRDLRAERTNASRMKWSVVMSPPSDLQVSKRVVFQS